MTNLRRALLLIVATAGGPLLATGIASAAAPTISTAPGRVVIPLDGGQIDNTDAAGGARDAAVALPNGGAVVSVDSQGGRAEIVQLKPDGSLDPSFGAGGILDVTPANVERFGVEQVVRQPDGKLILVGGGENSSDSQTPQVVLVRLNADGSLDQSFAGRGVDVLPVLVGCGACTTLALRPDGGFVVSGSTVQASVAVSPTVNALITDWVVAGLTPTGALDPGFGQSGIVTLAQNGASGTDLAVLPGGDVVASGSVPAASSHFASQFIRLLPSGAPDPAFHGGTPEYLPSPASLGGFLAYPDGSVVFGLEHAIVRYTAAGLPDPKFGAGGVVQTGSPQLPAGFAQLFPSAGDGALVITEKQAEYAGGDVQAERIASNGAVDQTLGGPTGVSVNIPFGGGSSSFVTSERPRPIGSLDQNTFTGAAVQRPDGSFLFLGDAVVSQPTGEGEGRSVDDFAAAALTSSFATDTSFGGAVTPLHAGLTLAKQRAHTALSRHGIRVNLNVSAPGLARVVIRGDGRVVAQSILPVFHAGQTTLPVELTTFGAKWLHSHPRGRLTGSVRARDLLTSTAMSTASGALR